MESRVHVADCELGKGVFAKRTISRGEEFLELEGKVITFEEAREKGEAEANPVQIGNDQYLDVIPPGMYLNHSCNPNAGVVRDKVLIALRDIGEGEEVRIDYSTTMHENSWKMACRCGEKGCRKIVTDFQLLPEETQHKYLRLGVVQDFICRKYKPMNDSGALRS